MKSKLPVTLGVCAALSLPVWAQAPVQTPRQQPGHEGHNHAPGEGHDEEKVAPQNENNTDYLWRKSDAAFHGGDYERAVGLHKAIVALDPTDVESFSVASWLLWSMKKVEESNAHIERGVAANPQNPEMWDAAGQHYDLQKNFAKSKESYARAVELSGKDAPQLMRRRFAHASEKAGDLNGSVVVWQGLVKDFPGEAVNQNNLKRVQESQKNAAPKAEVAALGALGVVGLIAVPMWKRRKRMV